MNATFSSLRGLYWKETRQVIPLISILLGVALLMMTIWTTFSSPVGVFAYSGLYIPMFLPALYAAGAAVMLVGQEKEQKTLWWLASLPTPAWRLISVKFVVAFAGLVVMWLCCWLLTQLASWTGPSVLPAALQFDFFTLGLFAVYVLVCSFYSAWRLSNTFGSLIAIVPLASTPIVVVGTLYALRQAMAREWIAPVAGSAAIQQATLVATIIIGWLAYRAAYKNLQPAEPHRLTPEGRRNWLDTWRPTAASRSPSEPYRLSISSLLWQSIHHNGVVLAGIFVMLSLGVASLAMVSYSEILNDEGPVLVMGTLAAAVGAAWLGVFVFTGDGSSERIRFLAERGISPTRVWVGRQMIGVSLLSLALLLFTLLSLWSLSVRTDPNAVIPSVALISIIGGVTYSVSQWTSQLLRLLAASAFVAPVLSVAVVYWFTFAATEMDAPLWLLLVCCALPMLATWLLMRQYMDGHRGLTTWLTAVATVLLIVVVPMAPMAIEAARLPLITASDRAKLGPPPTVSWRSSGTPQRITLASEPGSVDIEDMSGATALREFERRSFRPSDCLDLYLDDTRAATPVRLDYYVIEAAISLATYEKLRFESSPEDESAADLVGQWITALTHIATRLRLSEGWWDQNVADVIEIWLTKTLSSDSFQRLWDRDFCQAAIQLLSDQQGRNARRRAILKSADGSYTSSRFQPLAWSRTPSATKRRLMKEKEQDAIIAAALRLIEDGSAGKPTEAARRELHDLIIGPSIEFSDGPYSDRIRVGSDGVLSMQQRPEMYPFCHWYAPWETDALRLADQQVRDDDSNDSVRGTP